MTFLSGPEISLILIFTFFTMIQSVYAEPVLKDNDFVVEKFVSGITNGPTTMAFEGNDILLLQKTDGQVRLISNGVLQEKPILDENVTSEGEQGMLGITTTGSKVYLYFTESTHDGGKPLGKRVYSYNWNGQELINKNLVKDLWATQIYHNGGAMTTDLNGSVYLVVGDAGLYGKLQNHNSGEPTDTSVILRIMPTGPYYAIGIRNSFGLAVDPMTGNLWDTENGADDFDEINLVAPNFNSGWDKIMGPATEDKLKQLPGYDGYVYSDPEFSWQKPVAPTGLSFINSKEFEKYKNTLFVGDCNNGNLYKFELNKNRDSLVFNSMKLSDNVLNIGESMDEILFGTGFGCVTDVEAGPDGLLYVVSLSDGTIYRIKPAMLNNEISSIAPTFIQYLIYGAIISVIISFIIYLKSNQKIKR